MTDQTEDALLDPELIRDLTPEQITELVQSLPDNPELLNKIIEALTPVTDTPIPTIEEIGRMLAGDNWQEREHSKLIARALTNAVHRVEQGESVRMVISVPPGSGKSTLGSVALPLHVLSKHPDWPIGIVSAEQSLANKWSRDVRRAVLAGQVPVAVSPDSKALTEWETTEGGALIARGVGASIVGRRLTVLVIDDPVKDFADAYSLTARNLLWDRWVGVLSQRLHPAHLVVLIMCMTGDTPVLMADGSEKSLKEIRPGDLIGTFENGELTTSKVLNWINQGSDNVYSVTMESGRVVRANARHPFRTVDAEGRERWTRVSDLRSGDRVKSVERLPRERGEGFFALRKAVEKKSVLRDYANLTTTRLDGLQGTEDLPKRLSGSPIVSIVTGLMRRAFRPSWTSKTGDAPYVDEFQMLRTPEEDLSCSSTMNTSRKNRENTEAGSLRDGSGDCCVMTAISSSDTGQQSNDSLLLSNIYEHGVDRVVSVVLDGYEDVFDIEVEHTHNFIANGLQVSNTRWHGDDLAGRLIEDAEDDWEYIKIPAIAETHDLLGREPGQPLLSPQRSETPEMALARWEKIRSQVGSYVFDASYQQNPAPPGGATFQSDWFQWYEPHELPPTVDGQWLTSWDLTFGTGSAQSGDFVVGQVWQYHDGQAYLIDQVRGRWQFTDQLKQIRDLASRYPQATMHLIEKAADGYAAIDTLLHEIPGIVAVPPRGSKEIRAQAVAPMVEAGQVHLPTKARWSDDLLMELLAFPSSGVHDDQVDALSQALMRFREPSTALIYMPENVRALSSAKSLSALRRGAF